MPHSRRRLLHIITSTNIGGGTMVPVLLAERLSSDFYESALAAGVEAPEEGSLRAEILQRGLRLFDLPALVRSPNPARDWAALGQMRLLLREFRPDIVHIHGSKPKLLFPWVGGKVPVRVASVHNWEWSAAGNPLERQAFRAAAGLRIGCYQRLVPPSHATRAQGLEMGIGRPEQYEVIHPPVDVSRFLPPTPPEREAVRATLGLSPSAFVIISVTRLAPQKAPADLLQAFRAVHAQVRDTCLLMVGGGPLEADLRQLAGSLGIGDAVRFLGPRRDVPHLLGAADCFALSSAWEPFGIVYIEAAATGLPCVGTAVDGAVEAVADGVNGLLTPPGQPEPLAEALLRLSRDSRLREQMSQASVAHARQFGIESCVARYDALYRQLWQEHGGGL